MRREVNYPDKYLDVIRSIGSPNKTVRYNEKVLTGHRWTTINRNYCIDTGLIVRQYQHQNYPEGMGGNFKLVVVEYTMIHPMLLHHNGFILQVSWRKHNAIYQNLLLMTHQIMR